MKGDELFIPNFQLPKETNDERSKKFQSELLHNNSLRLCLLLSDETTRLIILIFIRWKGAEWKAKKATTQQLRELLTIRKRIISSLHKKTKTLPKGKIHFFWWRLFVSNSDSECWNVFIQISDTWRDVVNRDEGCGKGEEIHVNRISKSQESKLVIFHSSLLFFLVMYAVPC